MEIINYFEAPQYGTVKKNKSFNSSLSIKELASELGSMATHSIEMVNKHKIVLLAILLAYGIILMIPFFHDTILRYFKTVSISVLPEIEVNILDSAMKDFVLKPKEDEFDSAGNIDGISPVISSILQPVSYSTYKVRAGDNITNIARKFGLANISTLIAVNEIPNVRLLRSGTILQVPSMDGIIHKVAKGESLNTIADKYKISLESLLDVNDLTSDIIQKDDKLFIPGARLDSNALRDAMGELFKMPLFVKWRLTSPFGNRSDPFTGVKKFHTGIDMAAPKGTSVKASMAGKVATTGYNNIYGYYVIMNHGNGYQTLYAHLLKYTVRTGQFVDQGIQIGLLGSTGYSTGPHLHFSVYKNGKLVNPSSLLK